MTRDKLIKQCRYYKGEDRNPYAGVENMSWFWDMERVFVSGEGELLPMHVYYERIGGKKYPGIPYPRLIVMFTSWGKQTYDLKAGLPYFYQLIDEYLWIPNQHYPEGEIPS